MAGKNLIMVLQCVLTSAFECSRRTHAGCVRTQASVQSLQILARFESRLGIRESGHSFKIGVANQANPKMQNNGGPQNRDQPLSGLHFSAHHFSAAWVRVPCSVFLQYVLTSGVPRFFHCIRCVLYRRIYQQFGSQNRAVFKPADGMLGFARIQIGNANCELLQACIPNRNQKRASDANFLPDALPPGGAVCENTREASKQRAPNLINGVVEHPCLS
jgi:hypothetical protein